MAAGHRELLKKDNLLLKDLLTTWKVTQEAKAIAFQRDIVFSFVPIFLDFSIFHILSKDFFSVFYL